MGFADQARIAINNAIAVQRQEQDARILAQRQARQAACEKAVAQANADLPAIKEKILAEARAGKDTCVIDTGTSGSDQSVYERFAAYSKELARLLRAEDLEASDNSQCNHVCPGSDEYFTPYSETNHWVSVRIPTAFELVRKRNS